MRKVKNKWKTISTAILTLSMAVSVIVTGNPFMGEKVNYVKAANTSTTRIMEYLNRGLIAMYTESNSTFISWRMLGTDNSSIGFNLYRSTDGGSQVKLNTSGVITTKTNWTDTTMDSTKTNVYTVKSVVNGVEEKTGQSYTIKANATAKQYIPIPLKPIIDGNGVTLSSYYVLHTYVGDLNGDGEYEYVVKRFSDDRTPIYVDAYKLDGTLLWRVNLGTNIETGNSSATAPILVADFDSDGKAEVMMKTAEETVFGDGTKIGDTNSDGITDYNSHDSSAMYQVLTGPEFLSMIDGETGKELDRIDFIARGTSSDWGDNYGNRMNFIFATIAYLDGVHPSIVISRGATTLNNNKSLTAVALSFNNGVFSQQWDFKTKDYKSMLATGQNLADFHAIRAIDVDNDGKDEISWGGFAVDNNGKLLYSTELGHGDRFVIADIDPNRAGLECYAIQQNNSSLLGAALYDAATGAILKKWYLTAITDVGRGEAASVINGQYGMQLWNSALAGFYTAQGTKLSSTSTFPCLSLWWDGDVTRESLDYISGSSIAINKISSTTFTNSRLFSIYSDNNGTICPYGGRPSLYGDILGDWREEILLESADKSELRIYSTKIPTDYRMPTLMHDASYRNCVNVKGYLQSTQTDFYFGYGMTLPVSYPSITTIAGNTTTPTPTAIPTAIPTATPIVTPTVTPTAIPTATPIVTPTVIPTPTVTTSPSNTLQLTTETYAWSTGYTMNMYIKNTSTSTVNSWKLIVNKADFNVTNIWNATVTESGDTLIITPMSWNQTISAGSIVSFGFQANGSPVSNFTYKLN